MFFACSFDVQLSTLVVAMTASSSAQTKEGLLSAYVDLATN